MLAWLRRTRRDAGRNAPAPPLPRTAAERPHHPPPPRRSDPWRTRRRRFLSAYRPHVPLLLADLGCAVLVAATALALPLCANHVARRLGALGEGPGALSEILLVGAVMLGLLAAQALGTLFVDYQGHMMGARMEGDLRRELFEHCQKLSFAFHDRQRVGQLMSRITNDLFDLGELYHHGPEDLAIAALKFAGVVALLASLDGPLTLLILAVTPLALAYALHFNGRMNRAVRLAKERVAAINERVEDALAGVRVVQSFANEELEVRRFEAENAGFLESRRAGYRSEAFFSVGTSTFAELLTVLVIVAGAVRVAQAQLGIADMLTFLLCVAVLVDPVQRLTNLARLWQQGFTGFVRTMEILEIEPDVGEKPGAAPLARPRGALAFRNVDFRYGEGGPPVLRDLSLDVAPGEFVALVGPSGVGKSTLCALIPRFYDATAGQVLVDGTDVRDLRLGDLRRAVGVVQQDVYLFAGSVAENLRYGRPGASDAEIVAAARDADAHDFIESLPEGYATNVGQRGVRLSGGQKQRLTIARAFLKDPAILIFDEATSALDNASERAVQDAIVKLARNRTTLVIAHRLSTVRRADRILVMTAEGIAEAGTHDALLAADGAYARLHRAEGGIR